MLRPASRIALVLAACACALPLGAQDQRPVPAAVWAPKPGPPPAYPPGHNLLEPRPPRD